MCMDMDMSICFRQCFFFGLRVLQGGSTDRAVENEAACRSRADLCHWLCCGRPGTIPPLPLPDPPNCYCRVLGLPSFCCPTPPKPKPSQRNLVPDKWRGIVWRCGLAQTSDFESRPPWASSRMLAFKYLVVFSLFFAGYVLNYAHLVIVALAVGNGGPGAHGFVSIYRPQLQDKGVHRATGAHEQLHCKYVIRDWSR